MSVYVRGYMFRDADLPLPPQKFMDAVAGQATTVEMHNAVARHLHELVIEITGLLPTERLLDIGSGCGRLATTLVGRCREYHGIDVGADMVRWCRENIANRHANFHFHHADLDNSHYRGGAGDAARYRFPFNDAVFDVIVAFSVFTHLVPASAHQYAREISRTLRPGGRALLTFFLVNDEWRAQTKAGQTFDIPLPYEFDEGCRVTSLENPEATIAYEQSAAVCMLESSGLKIQKISLGKWSRHSEGWTGQDAILATR